MSRKLNTLFSLMMLLSLTLTACSGGAQAMQPATEDASKAAEGSAHSGESNSAPQGNASNQQTRTNRTGGWFDEIIFTSVPDPEPAVAQIQADAIDMYSATIDKTEVLAQVQADQKLGYHNTYGSSNQLLFNPVA